MLDSLGLVDFATGLVNSVLNLPDRQVEFWGEFKLQKNCNQSWSVSCKTDFLCTLGGALSYKQVSATNRVWLSGSEVLNRVSVIFLQIVVLSHESRDSSC